VPFGISAWELAILLVVALLLFGAKRLPEMGRSLGRGMREFKDAVTGKDDDEARPRELSAGDDEEPVPTTSRAASARERERDTVS
jgi:sec-independent protein translocase protein TatA